MTARIPGDSVLSKIWFAAPAPGRWAADATCRNYPAFAEYFTDATSFAEADLALTLCADCPVRAACLGYGQRLGADGVWGGQLLHHGVVQHRLPRRASRDDAEPAAS